MIDTSRTKTSIPRVVVAGLRGGAGKTTLSVGLTAALSAQGIAVSPFKKGPDYIDAGWLASSAGRPCYNLDPYLIGEDRVLSSFVEHARGAGCAIIEGNRGLFDGMDAQGSQSTSKVARILKSPVILILDCTKATRTIAAQVLGVKRFEHTLRLEGVVLNMIAGKRHESVIREAVEGYTGVPVLGAIPRLSEAELPERHMGLTPWQEHPDVPKAVRKAADIMEKFIDLSGVLTIARSAPSLPSSLMARAAPAPSPGAPRIGVVRDPAFQFYYPENIEELMKRGSEVVELSALSSPSLPPLDALYIGGGFPETNAIALSKNRAFIRSLKKAIEGGLPVYAECGGLMYLGQSLVFGGRAYPMAGVFPASFAMHAKPRAHGYTLARVTAKNPFYKRGTELRGHEFHYSEAVEVDNLTTAEKGAATLAFRMQRGKGIARGRDGLCYKNVLATYTHTHALGTPEWAEGMVRAASRYAKERAGR